MIWTPRVVLYTKLPLVSPDTEKTGRTTVLQTGPLTRVCELLRSAKPPNAKVQRPARNTVSASPGHYDSTDISAKYTDFQQFNGISSNSGLRIYLKRVIPARDSGSRIP